jgi:hypothetical protein
MIGPKLTKTKLTSQLEKNIDLIHFLYFAFKSEPLNDLFCAYGISVQVVSKICCDVGMIFCKFHAISLHYVYYNFVRIHKTLRVTPAMEAGLTKKLWDISDIVRLIERL